MSNDLCRVAKLLCSENLEWETVLLEKKEAVTVTFCNPLTIKIVQQQPGFIDVLDRFDYIFPDGVLLAKIASRIVGKKINRFSFDGNSLAATIFSISQAHQLKIGIIGSRHEITNKADLFLKQNGLTVEYCRNGFFDTDDAVKQSYDEIQMNSCDIIIVGMGGGRQEDYIMGLIESGWTGTAFTCGGYFDQIAERGLRYYPEIVNRLHLRALFRLINEPTRLIPRYTVDYWPFYKEAFSTLLQ